MITLVISVHHAHKLSGPAKTSPLGEGLPLWKFRGKCVSLCLSSLFVSISNEGTGLDFN